MSNTTTSKAQAPSGQSVQATATIEAPKDSPTARPIWIRLPKNGQLCPHTGLSRSSMNALILGNNPQVESVSLRKRYAIRGTRLIHLGSLLEYIAGMAAAQRAEISTPEMENQTGARTQTHRRT